MKKAKTPKQKPKARDRDVLKATGNRQIVAQNRKLLGKHYASKYRTDKGG